MAPGAVGAGQQNVVYGMEGARAPDLEKNLTFIYSLYKSMLIRA